jgi:hypothetical protein
MSFKIYVDERNYIGQVPVRDSSGHEFVSFDPHCDNYKLVKQTDSKTAFVCKHYHKTEKSARKSI